jgi:pimeloyl-ACP methyl ester carboxylesterase
MSSSLRYKHKGTCTCGFKGKAAVRDLIPVAEKHGPSCEPESPAATQHPLFPPLPSYGLPTFPRKLRYYAIQIVSFYLSLAFLSVIFVGALLCTAGTVISDIILRLKGQDPASKRKFFAEEQTRRSARANSDTKWHVKGPKEYVDEEQALDECPPLEGGKDRLVCDVAYYARRVGLDVETFRVQTEDGFIIELWHVYNPLEYTALSPEQRRERGPSVFDSEKRPTSSSSNRRYPVLLVHGLLQSAGAYCTNDDDSLAFFLCKSGYDVWLGNNRCGTSPEHTSLSPSDPRMWSWDIRHLGTLDLVALTSRVLYETGFEKLGLVCHSQGTTQTFIALAKEHRPELGERISVFCALAPAAYAGPLVSRPYFRFMQLLSPRMFRIFFGIHSFIPLMMSVQRVINPRIYGTMAYWVFSSLFGWSDARWERDLRHRMFQFAPVYVSAESMRWWLGSESFAKHRCILSTIEDSTREANEDCRSYDGTEGQEGDDPSDACLGSGGDKAWFGPQTPPFALWIGGSDALVDGRKLLHRFDRGREPDVKIVYSKVIDDYEHLDVLWAMDAVEQVGREVRQVLFDTMPEDARKTCRVPRGINPSLLNLS